MRSRRAPSDDTTASPPLPRSPGPDAAAAGGAAGRRSSFWFGPWPAAILGLLCFANTLGNDFTYDDHWIIEKHPRVRDWTDVRAIWLTDWWYGQEDVTPLGNPQRDRLYRPLTLFSFALNYAAGGLSPVGFHAVNIGLHALTCAMVWLLTKRLVGDAAVASLAAVLFAVHPVHVEAVAGLVGRAEILAALFLLVGLALLLPSGSAANLPTLRRCAAASAAFFAALLAKETAICFPALAGLLAWHCWGRGAGSYLTGAALPRLDLRSTALRAAVLLVPLIVYFPLRFAALEQHLIRSRNAATLFNPLVDADAAGRLVGALSVLGHYVRVLLVPSRLSCDYGLAIMRPDGAPGLMTLVGVLSAVAMVALLAAYARRLPARWSRAAAPAPIRGPLQDVGLMAAMFVASYLLISNTFLLIGVALAERLMYWPSVPVTIGLAIATLALWRRYLAPGCPWQARADLLRLLGGLLVAALALRSVVRSADWADDLTLFTVDAAQYPQGAQLNTTAAQLTIARAAKLPAGPERETLLAQADAALDRALAIYSRHTLALRHKGAVRIVRGQPEQAIPFLQRALQLEPADRIVQQQLAELRGESAELQARWSALDGEIRRRPEDLALRLEAARVLVGLGQNFEALQQYEAALRIDADSVDALRGYGEAMLLNLRNDAALEAFRKVLERAPDDWQTHNNMVGLLEERDPAAALVHARRAFELQPDDLRVQFTLVEALVVNSRFDEALQRLRWIEQRLPADDPLRAAATERIREVEAKRP